MFLLLVVCFLYLKVVAKNVKIEVKGTWKKPGLVSMASEFLHETKYKTFWDIFAIQRNEGFSSDDLYSLLKEEDKKLFEYSMSIHYFAPLLNTFQQIGEQRLLSMESGSEVEYFVDCGGDNFFTQVEELESFLASDPSIVHEIEIYPFDHVFPKSSQQSATCVLYGLVEDERLLPFHEFLKDNKDVRYLFRHYYPMLVNRRDHFTSKTFSELDNVQGYGMSLKIKNQEYRTMDPKNRPKAQAPSEFGGIKFDYLIEKHPDLDFKLNLLREQLVKEMFDLGGELKAWDIQDIGFSTAHMVAESDAPLSTLQELTTNFPSHVTEILESAKTNTFTDSSDERSVEFFKKNLKHNAEMLGAEDGEQVRLFFNNKEIDLEMTTIFTLRDIIKNDLEGFNKLKTFEPDLPFHEDKEEMESFTELMTGKTTTQGDRIFDILSFPQIHWLNDIENDRRYSSLDKNVKTLLRPPHYGRQPVPRRNMFQFVYLVDPSTSEGVTLLWKAQEVLNYGAPFRVGFVFYPFAQSEQTSMTQRFDVNVMGGVEEEGEDDSSLEPTIGEKLMTVLAYIQDKQDTTKMFDFLVFFRNFLMTHGMISEGQLQNEFKRHAPSGLSYDELIDNQDNFEKYSSMILQDTFLMLEEKKIPKNMDKPIVLVNGRLIQNSDSSQLEFGNLLQTYLNEEIERMKKLVEDNVITNNDNDIFLKLVEHYQDLEEEDHIGRVFERYDEQIFGEPIWKSYTGSKVNEILPPMKFVTSVSQKKEKLLPYTHVLCALDDEDRKKSLDTVLEALRYFKNHKEGQMGILFSEDDDEFSLKFWKFLDDVELFSGSDVEDLVNYINSLELLPDELETAREQIEEGRMFCQTHYTHSKLYLSSHGRIIHDASKFSTVDYEVLEKYLSSLQLQKLYERFERYYSPEEEIVFQNLYVYYSAIILGLNSENSNSGLDASNLPNFDQVTPTIQHKGDVTSLTPNVHLIMDPLSSLAPKWSTIVKVLFADFFNFEVNVYLTPKSGISQLPLQSWYRYVLSPSLDEDTFSDVAYFADLPDRFILTVTPDEPENWLLESTYSEYDLDNLNLELMEEEITTEIRYQLENIVYTGQTHDTTTSNAPRGLQFELVEAGTGFVVDDTLVMSNFGYFQFKANPGVFNFRISGSRANAIYRLGRVELGNRLIYELEKEEEEGYKTISVYVNHFDGAEINVKVQRRPGMDKVELFDDTPLPGEAEEEKKGGLFNRLFGGSKKAGSDVDVDDGDEETLNIFSVASGHLYERLLRIMMRSIMEHTTKKVRFLIIKNYLSPQFKEYLPHISKKFGFQYSLITYKWPTWLHKQTNKIRIIWAYKVLFLDVLFPLDVKKIIYVDADQVTRADMTELWEMDLNRRVIALTPFCNDKPQMDGYAFWKRGYWANHLQGKPYHISALYVVDVENFRKRYAGDQYRVVYSNLAKDPNSLSNLDQDLPNFVQHMIPIHSLPQEWLWCETWCSDKSKKKAKTIDLCNNPMTKEHKLSQAKRIVGEWVPYDEEMTEVVKKLQEEYGIIEK